MRQILFTMLFLAALSAQAGVKLYVFDCGNLKFDDVSAFGLTNEETGVRELFVPCYLIEHENGRLLWDAGLPTAIAGLGPVEMESGALMELARSLSDQLAEMDLSPADIEQVAFSHMHFDHVGSANLFSGSTLLIQKTEFEAAFGGELISVFDPTLYADLADSKRKLLNGDHDVFGDGSVTIISAPGHTVGHQVLLLRLANFGPLILSGDLYHFEASRLLRRTPDFNFDKNQTLQSMDKVEALIEDTGATFWIEHNKALADTLTLAPAYYD